MSRVYAFLLLMLLSAESMADKVVQVDGASMAEIATRAEGGMSTFYRLLSLVLVVVGLYLFATALIKLINIVKGIDQQGKPMGAVAGMLFAAMLSSTGYWLFAISGGIKAMFVS